MAYLQVIGVKRTTDDINFNDNLYNNSPQKNCRVNRVDFATRSVERLHISVQDLPRARDMIDRLPQEAKGALLEAMALERRLSGGTPTAAALAAKAAAFFPAG